jgi:uncharacterized protein
MNKRSKADEQEIKKKLTAFGYLSAKGKDGDKGRLKFYLGIVIFLALLAVVLYLSSSIFAITTQKLYNSPSTMVSLLILGLVVGIIVGLTSVGSGALMTPILYLDFSKVLTHAQAVGTATAQGTVTKFAASIRNYLKKSLNSGYAFTIAITGVPLAVVGAFLTKIATSYAQFQVVIAVILVLAALSIIYQIRVNKEDKSFTDPKNDKSFKTKGMLIGAYVGLIAGVTGISTGSLLVASLMIILKFRPHTAVNIAIFEGGIILLAATATQIFLGNVAFLATGLLILGGVPGILIGNHYKDQIGERILGYGVAGVIIFESARVISSYLFGKTFFIF